ncbi:MULTISPECIES: hypothetical protein [Paenibacillus]|uniref:ABM domain-containing protein n=1 Tax=Paenibacillus xylanilyticus TaxID=248903 RepID=A0A7Y6EUV3_9BACL|nr:hypothetical protein [Paenibacillus xylanilyticus]NUU75158.1 hypothetical protein [Paenibacillus xylanilyticus]
MFVKVYQYQIQPGRIEEFLEIQKKSAEIYASYIDFHSFCINSNQDKSKWLEISKYKDENEYRKSINLINDNTEIRQLFEKFSSLLVNVETDLIEEEYTMKFNFNNIKY